MTYLRETPGWAAEGQIETYLCPWPCSTLPVPHQLLTLRNALGLFTFFFKSYLVIIEYAYNVCVPACIP